MSLSEAVDVVIVGGGPAGLNAALLLGRSMRRVTIVDISNGEKASDPECGCGAGHAGSIPNGSTQTNPAQLHKFERVTYQRATVDDVERSRFGFMAHCSDGTTISTRVLLLASDIVAPIPAIPGAAQFYGSSLHECPYCDGWEHRGRRIGVLGADEAAVDLALKLLQWSSRVTLFPNGGTVDALSSKRLEKGRVQVVTGAVTALEGQDGNLKLLRVGEATSHPCEALFFSSPRKYHSSLTARLGCDLERMAGAVHWRPDGDIVVEGLFVTGSGLSPGETTAIAASEGQKAAKAANEWLLEADQASLPIQSPAQGSRASRHGSSLRRVAI